MPLLNELSRERYEQSINEPFSPPRSATRHNDLETDPALRIAHALEYIAAQLGQINLKIEGKGPFGQTLAGAGVSTVSRGFD